MPQVIAEMMPTRMVITTTTLAGTYTLTVESRANGCTATDTVTVTANQVEPVSNAGPNKGITCDDPVITLDGSASGGDGSAGYSYSWSPSTWVSDPSIPQPTTDRPGTFTLTVTDLANGCTDLDAVVVAIDQRLPTANAGPDRTITCDEPEV